MSRHHVIISGTGRAGTTFLVQLLTALKLDTGYYNPTSFIAPKRWHGRLNLKRKIDPKCNAGLELDIRQADAPYIVKSPFLCDDLDELIREDQIVVDHAIIPMRDLYSAAESRRVVDRNTRAAPDEKVAGGLMNTKAPEEQESTLARMLHNLFFVIAKHDIPVTLLHFPRLVSDPEYLYKKLGFLFPDIGYDDFLQCFQEMSRPELVHDFKANSHAESSGMREDAPGEERPAGPLEHASGPVLPAAAESDVPGFLRRMARWMGSSGEDSSGLRKKSWQKP